MNTKISSWKLRAFRSSSRVMELLIAGTAAINQGFWLGLYDNATVQEVTSSFYANLEVYHHGSYNFRGLNLWERDCITRYFGECKSILIGAAGGGREMIALAKEGYAVTGFECVKSLVDTAQDLIESEKLPVQIFLSPPNSIPENLDTFDGLILGWGAYMHMQGRENRIQFLKQLRKHVKSGAPFLLSFSIRNPDARFYKWIYHVAAFIRRLRGSEIPELGDILPDTFDHYTTEEEIREELHEAGFEITFFSATPYAHAVALATD